MYNLDDNLLNDPDKTEPTVDLDFHGLYQLFAEAESVEMREIVAACIHEPFVLRSDAEDISLI
jgi:hypothetical protein